MSVFIQGIISLGGLLILLGIGLIIIGTLLALIMK